MKLFRAGDDDALIQEAWFILWLVTACGAGFSLGHWAGAIGAFAVICAIRGERSL